MIKLRTHRTLLVLLAVWFFVSAFYYASNFISGDLLANRSTDQFHKVAKYLIALSLSIAAVFLFRHWTLLLLYLILSLLLLIFALLGIAEGNASQAMDTIVILISFVGITAIFSNLKTKDLEYLIRLIIISSIIISSVSFFEFLFMEQILGTYWRNTGGYRSVSTLLNPNNFGLYIGASILLLIRSEAITYFRAPALLILSSALIMSGSRTAMLALMTALVISVEFRQSINRNTFYKAIGFIVVTPLALVTLAINIGIADRAVNFETAAIRIEKYFQFVTEIDITYLWPDLGGGRSNTVSESSYFYTINSLGLLVLLIIFLLLALFFRLRRSASRDDLPERAMYTLFAYYLVASLFENVIFSFPNNQLFFASAGSIFALRCWPNLARCRLHGTT